MADMTPNPSGLYITQITLPSNSTYEIVDQAAREKINTMSNYSAFLGVVSNSAAWTKIEDGSTTASILVGSTTVTAVTGNVVIYKPSNSTSAAQEFIFDGTKWNFFGDIGAKDLGTLAYKSSATYVKFSSVNVGSNTVSSSGKFTPAGTVSFNGSATAYVQLSSTTTAPTSNCSNYWMYTPAGTITVTYTAPSTSADVINKVTAKKVVTTATITAPTSSAPTGSLGYASVSDHVLSLSHLVMSTDTAATTTTTKAYVTVATAKTTTCSFSGTTIYAIRQGVSIPNSATFSGTEGTVSVSSTAKFVNSVTSSTASANVSFA